MIGSLFFLHTSLFYSIHLTIQAFCAMLMYSYALSFFFFFWSTAFAPINGGTASDLHDTNSLKQPFDAQRYFSHSESD